MKKIKNLTVRKEMTSDELLARDFDISRERLDRERAIVLLASLNEKEQLGLFRGCTYIRKNKKVFIEAKPNVKVKPSRMKRFNERNKYYCRSKSKLGLKKYSREKIISISYTQSYKIDSYAKWLRENHGYSIQLEIL